MHAVILTPTFLADTKAAGLPDDEREIMISEIAKNPLGGDAIEGTGGARKMRFAGRGKGKSGGYRTVHYFAGDDVPILLLALINKGESANLSKAERNELKRTLAGYADDYRNGVEARISEMHGGS